MIDDFTLQLLAGGVYRCDPTWSRKAGRMDGCFKCYLPVSGAARVCMDEIDIALHPGRIYLFDGHRLQRQACPRAMRVYWVHFAPVSLYLQRRLELAPALSSWPAGECADLPALKAVPGLFDRPFTRDSHAIEEPPVEWACRVQALLLERIAHHLARTEPAALSAFGLRYERLRPAILHMDRHFANHPPLAELAALVGQSPEHFHRSFRSLTGATPFCYLLRLRMTRARRLLHGGLSVKEAAAQCGYEDPLYFSRVFSRHFRQPPSECRRAALGG